MVIKNGALVVEKYKPATQEKIIAAEDLIREKVADGTYAEPEILIEDYYADRVYGRVMKVMDPGTMITGEAHKTEHIFVLMKGTLQVSMDDGSVETIIAPHIMVVPGGKKKIGYCIDEVWCASFHPDPRNSRDVEKIKKRILYPERKYRTMIANQNRDLLE